MEPLLPPPDIAPADWEQTPPAVRQLSSPLLAQVADLTARLGQHSGNSSRPPSTDPPSAPKRPVRPPRGRRRGGQPGHPGPHRPLGPPDQLEAVCEHRPTACPDCQAPLAPDLLPSGPPRVQQVGDVPPIQPAITEHRFPTRTCPQCQQAVRAPPPPEVSSGTFGPHLAALVALLHGRYRLSVRETSALLADLFGLPVGLGSIPALCPQTSAALAAPYQEVAAQVATQPVANVDEPSWKQAGQRRWLWVAVTALDTLFRVAPQRNKAALRTLLGTSFAGISGSDRYSAYEPWPLDHRQLCWVHRQRDVTALAERSGSVGQWGRPGLEQIQHLFAVWHAFRQGQVERTTLQQQVAPIQAAWRAWLTAGRGWSCPRPRNLAAPGWRGMRRCGRSATGQGWSRRITLPSVQCAPPCCGAKAALAPTAAQATNLWSAF